MSFHLAHLTGCSQLTSACMFVSIVVRARLRHPL
jgi:hypothetical protein